MLPWNDYMEIGKGFSFGFGVIFTFYFFLYIKSSCVLLFVVFLMEKEIKNYLKKILSITFVFPDPKPPAINVLYGWSEISVQFILCFLCFLL